MTEIQIPDGSQEILKIEIGSTMHGIDIGSDDTDYMAVLIEPQNTLTGLQSPFESYSWRSAEKDQRSGPGDIDYVGYGLRKYLHLAISGNATIICPLYAPENKIVHSDEFGKELIELRESIVSFKVKNRFLGYMNGQRKRIENQKGSRQEKWASHMVRLGFQVNDLLETGFIPLPMPNVQARICKDIKRGDFSIESALSLASTLEEKAINKTVQDSVLPASPDVSKIEKWMHSVYMKYWSTL